MLTGLLDRSALYGVLAEIEGFGLGVLNMRERAQAVGGTCTAGPGGRGWLVHACLPAQAGSGLDGP